MKNMYKQIPGNSARRISHRSLVGILVVAFILIGVITALSTQGGQTQTMKIEEKGAKEKAEVTSKGQKNYVTSNAAGELVVLDRETGQTRGLSQDETRRLAEGLKQIINQSSEGLVQIEHKDGSVSMDLQGRFQNVMLAKKEDDGSVSQSCVDNLEAAANFFEIDPALLGLASPVSKSRPSSTKLEIR